MLSRGFPRNPRELSISSRERYRPPMETRGGRGRMDEQSYEPIVPRKVGNRRARGGCGHGTHWREGGNNRTSRLGDTWRHTEVEDHVHTTQTVNRASQGKQDGAISHDGAPAYARGVV